LSKPQTKIKDLLVTNGVVHHNQATNLFAENLFLKFTIENVPLCDSPEVRTSGWRLYMY